MEAKKNEEEQETPSKTILDQPGNTILIQPGKIILIQPGTYLKISRVERGGLTKRGPRRLKKSQQYLKTRKFSVLKENLVKLLLI